MSTETQLAIIIPLYYLPFIFVLSSEIIAEVIRRRDHVEGIELERELINCHKMQTMPLCFSMYQKTPL